MKNSNVQISSTKNKHTSFITTKRKLPVDKIVPLEIDTKENKKSYFGCLRSTVKINDDIVNFSCESDWE
ncbi:hypothetical protein H6P87_00036 [Rickettsia tillamookensis]|uniref:Uncharacterized protein n=2 Tax=Rickettsia tillamookensis TaxID=2761623 RepID=A0A9E6SPY1_9RICK|nr:hypothetical protein H6P87_00036 [Rickettsia tillamookensis]